MVFVIRSPQPTCKIMSFVFFVGRFDEIYPVLCEKPTYKNAYFFNIVGRSSVASALKQRVPIKKRKATDLWVHL